MKKAWKKNERFYTLPWKNAHNCTNNGTTAQRHKLGVTKVCTYRTLSFSQWKTFFWSRGQRGCSPIGRTSSIRPSHPLFCPRHPRPTDQWHLWPVRTISPPTRRALKYCVCLPLFRRLKCRPFAFGPTSTCLFCPNTTCPCPPILQWTPTV